MEARPLDPVSRTTRRTTRRTALRHGAGLAAVLAAFGARGAAAGQATPAATTTGSGLLVVQAFSQGSLFPTQGDGPDLPPYTAILWDVADRGALVLDPAGSRTGLVSTDRVLTALTAAAAPIAAIIARPGEGAEPTGGVWLLRLLGGSLGSDPGAVTYQGEAIDPNEAASFGVEATALPEGPQDLGSGFLIVSGLSGLASDEGIWLTWP